MRPLTLSIRGLRSYTGACSIDFTDRSLVAIVGDTGVGKSSILEAITYALYNSPTWTAGEVKPLIADGVQTMSVELVFLADGKRWKVHRSTSRGPHPPPLHRIECLDDLELIPVTGEELVRRQVQKLLGMNRKAFLSAVVLPQSRFQTLLHEEPAERTRILKGIFRLTELEAVRELADGLRRRAEPALERNRGLRASLSDDPAAAARRLELELARVAARHRRLQRLQTVAGEAGQAARDAAPRIRALEQPAALLAGLLTDLAARPPAPTLRALASLAACLDEEIAGVDGTRSGLEERERDLAGRQAAAGRRGESYEDLVAADQTLRQVARDLREIESTAERLRATRAELAAAEARLEGEAAKVRKLGAAAVAARRRTRVAAAELERRRRDLAAARQLLADVGQSAAALAGVREELASVRRRLRAAQPRIRRMETAAAAADEARTLTKDELERVRQAHAAAHAAHGLSPGDPCPICSRPVPRGFQPPPGATIGPAEEAFVRAAVDADERHRGLVTALLAADQLRAERARLVVMDRQAASRLASMGRELEALVPGSVPSGADRAQPRQSMDDEERALEERARRLQVRADRMVADRARAAAALELERRALDQGRRAVERSEETAAARCAECREALQRLPGFPRPADPLTATGLDPMRELVATRLRDTRAVLDERERTFRELNAARDQLDDLRQRREREVDRPHRAEARRLLELTSHLNQARQAAGLRPRAWRLAAEEPRKLADQATDLEAAARRLVAVLLEGAAKLRQRVERTGTRAEGRLRTAGFADQRALEEALGRTQRDAGRLEADLARALRQIPEAAELDRRIELGGEVADSLRELCRLLGDGGFVGHVIERRQRLLLAVASETLGAMTGGRYAFSVDFRVVDNLSGQPRSTKTLSGGETFLASLALALALVEIASRAGGRLDALFLDEGFGALDANALDEALAALERRASQGRLVAVVSHIKGVAERIETVLEVTRRPQGSVAVWSEGAARDGMVDRELEANLLV